jgi:hypothetical protein
MSQGSILSWNARFSIAKGGLKEASTTQTSTWMKEKEMSKIYLKRWMKWIWMKFCSIHK